MNSAKLLFKRIMAMISTNNVFVTVYASSFEVGQKEVACKTLDLIEFYKKSNLKF